MESAEIERELEELENRVERLRALYEQYFMGLEKLEPQIPRKDVDRRIWMLRREQIRNTGMRFKFQMIIQRYNTFQQYWSRVTREIESGTYRRDVMRAAVRVGEKEALTLVGKKRAKQYAALLEAQSARKRPKGGAAQPEAVVEDEEVALTDDDIEPASQHGRAWGDIADVMDDGNDDAPTPAPAAARQRAPAPSDSGFEIDVAGDVAAAFGAATPEAAAPPPNKSAGGLRWGAPPRVAAGAAPLGPTPSAPLRADIVERAVDPPAAEPVGGVPARPQVSVVRGGSGRVAELAAAMRSRAEEARTSAPLLPGLDLDLDDDHPLPPKPSAPISVRPSSAGAPAPRVVPFGVGGVARPNSAARPRRRSSRGMQAVRPPGESPAAAAPAQPLPAAPAAVAPPPPGAGSATPAAAAPPTGASAARPDVEAPAARPAQPRPAASRPEAPASKPAKPDLLSDQRIRQIYSKYVETKRSSNESTAGMTYERLAESLRSQANRLKTSHPTKSVDYEVVVKDGKTLLKPILR